MKNFKLKQGAFDIYEIEKKCFESMTEEKEPYYEYDGDKKTRKKQGSLQFARSVIILLKL